MADPRNKRNHDMVSMRDEPARFKGLVTLLIAIIFLLLSMLGYSSFRGLPKKDVNKLSVGPRMLPFRQSSSKWSSANPAKQLFAGSELELSESDKLTRGRALTLRQVFGSLLSQANRFDKRRLENDAFSSLAGDPAIVEMTVSLISRPASARLLFSEDEALVRVYAIRFLDFLANQGDRSAVEKATSDLYAELGTMNWEPSAGHYLDLEQLAHSALSTAGDPEEMVDRLDELLDRLLPDSAVLSWQPDRVNLLHKSFSFGLQKALGWRHDDTTQYALNVLSNALDKRGLR